MCDGLDLLLGIFFKLSNTVAGALKNRLSPLRGVEQELALWHCVDRSLLLLITTEDCICGDGDNDEEEAQMTKTKKRRISRAERVVATSALAVGDLMVFPLIV